MEGHSGHARVPEGSEPAFRSKDQITQLADIDTSEKDDQSKNLENMPSADPQQQSQQPAITKFPVDVAWSPSVAAHQQKADDMSLYMVSQGERNSGSRKQIADSSEAVKRGRSFGPLKKHGDKPASTGGILKAPARVTAKSPPPSSRQRSLSQGSEDLQPGVGVKLETSDYPSYGDGEGEGAQNSVEEDDDQTDSSDEESGQPRGRSGRGESPLADNAAMTATLSESEKPISTSKRFHKKVRPITNYDQKVSTRRDHEPHTSDSEEEESIRHAQTLPLDEGTVDNSRAHRASQIITRGNFAVTQRDDNDGKRRLRTYLVATDLSEEAAYALEWTIGTILRDGDTLFAVYAVDKEVGIPVGEGAKAMQEDKAEMDKSTAETSKPSLSVKMFKALPTSSRKSSSDSRVFSNAELDRTHAIDRLVKTCVGFLRKTPLQVRILVEVVHCKDPNHMIMEIIDCIEPTLVIVGSRGRTKLQGVLLGSFSNYIVSKSSAPVMVARKRLAGQQSKPRIPPLPNNLTTSRRLAAPNTEKRLSPASDGKAETKSEKSTSRSRSPGGKQVPKTKNPLRYAKIDEALNSSRSRSPMGKKD